MKRRLQLRIPVEAVITITRKALVGEKICYIVTSNRKFKYPHRKSRIAYIGMSERGVKRMLETAKDRVEDIFDQHGVKVVEFQLIRCTKRQSVPSWESLEKAMILLFKRYYGTTPFANIKGKGRKIEKWQKDLNRFNEASLLKLIEKYD